MSISMCPGWLKTGECSSLGVFALRMITALTNTILLDLGGEGALLDVSIGVAGVIKTISSLTPESNGKFYNFEGKQVPW